jgi:hypothetical protein
MTEFSLSTTVLSADGDRLYTFEYAASGERKHPPR